MPDAATWMQVRDTCMELSNTVAGLQAQLRQTRRTEEDADATGASFRMQQRGTMMALNKQVRTW